MVRDCHIFIKYSDSFLFKVWEVCCGCLVRKPVSGVIKQIVSASLPNSDLHFCKSEQGLKMVVLGNLVEYSPTYNLQHNHCLYLEPGLTEVSGAYFQINHYKN